MGNQPSKDNIVDVKNKLEKMYDDIFDKTNILKTIDEEYCENLHIYINNDVLNKLSKETLGKLGKGVLLGLEHPDQDEKKAEICTRLSRYYVKKVNLVGTIINVVRLAHLKLDRIKNGGICFAGKDKDILEKSNISPYIKVEPSIPLDIKLDSSLITFDKDVINIRKKAIEKAGLQKKNPELLDYLSMIEIEDRTTCTNANGTWLETRKEMEDVYLVPTKKLEKENKSWIQQSQKLENTVYSKISDLVKILDDIIEERTVPQMISGREHRIKVYKDKLILDTDLDTRIIKTKNLIIDLFIALDSMYLVLFSIRVIGQEHLDAIAKHEEELKLLKSRGTK
jgi:hypothetical protein